MASRTAPVVVADRLTDLVALVVLSLVGVSQFRQYLPVVVITLVLVAAAVVVLWARARSNNRLVKAQSPGVVAVDDSLVRPHVPV